MSYPDAIDSSPELEPSKEDLALARSFLWNRTVHLVCYCDGCVSVLARFAAEREAAAWHRGYDQGFEDAGK